MNEAKIESILPYVEKPTRYIGGETNSVVKDRTGKTTIVLSYPDAYEIGISNLGLKILYGIVNGRDDMVCETVYAPMGDMEEAMRREGVPLFSLETRTPVADFDVAGFTFQYELVFSNFVNMLDLAGIPRRSEDRTDLSTPFVIGGGPAMLNPEPVAPFLDAVCIGDGETRIVEMVRAVGEGKRAGLSRGSILARLAELDGVYVPSLHPVRESNGLDIPEGVPVGRYSEPDIETLPFPTHQILPNLRAVQDRAVVEASRGCSRGCRFCQAGFGYRPVRERSAASILDLARKTVLATGYREVSLISLSISDHTQLIDIIRSFHEQFSPKGISFSLPSLRLDSFTLELAERVSEIRSSGLTFAVEGGSQAVRDTVNKGVNEEELFRVAGIAQSLGWKAVKLYFMIGLPKPQEQSDRDSESEVSEVSEAHAIADLCERLTHAYPRMKITASVGVFVPKPHTPFERMPQMSPEAAWDVFRELLSRLKKYRRVELRFNDPYCSRLEGIFARGDRKLSAVVETAVGLGAKFDGWSEKFKPDVWNEAFRQCGIDPEAYLAGMPRDGEPLPWKSVDCGESAAFLAREAEKASRGELTPDCREECSACGVCAKGLVTRNAVPLTPVVDPDFLSGVSLGAPAVSSMRFVYTKTGSAKYISPIDLEEVFARAFFRANLPVKFTEGFNPHVRLEMGWAIPVGFESVREVSQLDLTAETDAGEFADRLNAVLPAGIRVLSARQVETSNRLNKRGHEQFVRFRVDADPETSAAKLAEGKPFTKTTPKGSKLIDMREFVRGIVPDGENSVTVEYFQKDGGARIQDVTEFLTGKDVRAVLALRPEITGRFTDNGSGSVDLIDL